MRRVISSIISFILSLIMGFNGGFANSPVVTGTNPAGRAVTLSETGSSLEVYFLDVGEGNAAVLISGGQVLMVDGGSPECSNMIYSFLKRKGIDYIDYMVATHPDADHVGGLSGALNAARVGRAFCTVTEHDTRTFRSFTDYLAGQGVSVTVPDAGDSFVFGSCEVKILAPVKGETRSDNTSIVLKVVCGETSFLFMGDSEKEDEDFLVNSGADIRSDVLAVGHHGSASSSYRWFINEVKPAYAVISVGENSYGHPADIVLDNLNSVGAEILRTDICGDIYCRSDGSEISFETAKKF